jgi:methylmalonyl-CoA mutase N-terminal domain/subunit
VIKSQKLFNKAIKLRNETGEEGGIKMVDEYEARYSNASHIPLKVVYHPEDIDGINYEREVGEPGEYPFTRGLYPTGYRKYRWVQRNICGFDLPEDTNQRIKQLFQSGQQGYGGQPAANIAFDLPTQLGLDSDHPLAKGDVGKVGCVCNTVGDMEKLFDSILLDNFNVGLNLNSVAPINLAMYIVNAENQGLPMKKLRGQNPNNPFIYMNGSQVIFPPDAHFRLMIDLMKFCTEHMPLWSTINLVGYYVSEGGGTAIQEVAYIIAQAVDVVQAGIKMGLNVDDFAPRLAAFVGLGMDFFDNIAKIRALRRMYSKLMRERFGAKSKKSCSLRIMTWTAGSSATAQQPLNNIGRVAIEVLSGALAGVQMIHSISYDEALLVPTEEAVHIAMMTQKIIEHEASVCDVADPLGGSYFLESLTNQIEEAAWKEVGEVEARGGFVACFKSGYCERQVLKERLRKQQEMEENKRIIVGVNSYVVEEETPVQVLTHNPRVREIAIERLNQWRKDRDQLKLKETLSRVKEAALGEGELMPLFIEAVRAKATLGEITHALHEVWGEYHHPAHLAR